MIFHQGHQGHFNFLGLGGCKMEKSKQGILEHYKRKEPSLFIQYDGFYEPEDPTALPDDDGHAIFSRLTYELMSGGPAVRVLITPETSEETIIKLLDKIKESIKKYGLEQNEVKKELYTFKKEGEMRNKLKESISTDNYTSEELEHLLGTIKLIRNQKELEDIPFF